MGGFMQPQGHVQVLMNMIDFDLNPQAAIDAPRWRWIEGNTVEVAHALPLHVAQALRVKGHDIKITLDSLGFGRSRSFNETRKLVSFPAEQNRGPTGLLQRIRVRLICFITIFYPL